MNWVNATITVLQLLPSIITGLKALEEAIPGHGKGEAKLAALRGILESVSAQVDVLWPAIEKVVGVLVGVFNKTGVFTASK
jgi:hypothetical protein